MVAPGHVREAQRAASEAAILDASWDLVARRGPDGASLRAIGARAGCTHTLVARYFGTKDRLVVAVAERMAEQTDHLVVAASAGADDPLPALLRTARRHRRCLQLLVRSALGDLPPRDFPGCLHLDGLLSLLPIGAPRAGGPGRRDRLCAYGAASLLLGFLTFEGFLVAATRLGPLAPGRRDVAVAGAARHLLDLAGLEAPRLAPRDLSWEHTLVPPVPGSMTARAALLRSAIQLFAERGPASVSMRAVARHAGVNLGLIHRHFGSKEALLAEALDQGVSGLFPAALADDGFDFDAMSWLLHHVSPAPRLIARTLVDDVEISTIRNRYPVVRRLIDADGRVPTGAGPGDLSDRRVAVMAAAGMALGSAVWGDHLRPALGLGAGDGIEAAVADLARHLVAVPAGPSVG